MVTNLITQDLLCWLQERFGRARQVSKGRVFTFGTALTCSINYSKLLGGHKYFYAIPQDMLNPSRTFPETEFGDFVVLICGAADRTLVLPRALVLDMMRNVTTRRVDIFVEDSSYVLQTTKHPKLTVTDFLNAFPAKPSKKPQQAKDGEASSSPDR